MEIDVNLQQELINAIAAFNVEKSWHDSPTIIAFVSGFSAIFGVLISNFFNVWSEKRREQANLNLVKLESEIRKQENIQEKQIEALQAISAIINELQPSVWPFPEYDSYEAYSSVVFEMGSLLDKVDNFLKNYSYIIPGEVVNRINVVLFKCNEQHWGASMAKTPDYQPNDIEIEAAEQVLKLLNDAVIEFKKILGVENA